tara:strand:+ start:758 stop:925 length:168 start_codon:yes stop_codon:yes gene_type:complete
LSVLPNFAFTAFIIFLLIGLMVFTTSFVSGEAKSAADAPNKATVKVEVTNAGGGE